MQTQSASGQRESIWRVAFASMIGTAIEWYDFFIFGTASALVFNQLYFPTFSELAGTLAALATFGVGFAARPLGGFVFGHMGDRVGRKTTLVVTLMMMGLGTFVIGLLPTFAVIGVWAPILLVVLRLVQGVAVGGEWGGAALMAVEHSGRRRRGFFGSFAQVGSAVGGLISTGFLVLMQQLLDPDAFVAWGWRVPFLASIVLVGVGLYIRLRIMESPVFAQIKQTGSAVKMPVVQLLRNDARNVLMGAGLYLAHGVAFYIMTVYTVAYTTNQYGLAENRYLTGVTIAFAVEILTILIFGLLSDQLGRRRVVIFGTLFTAAFAIPLYFMVTSQVIVLMWLAVIISVCIAHDAIYSPTAALYSEMFPAHIRYSGVSVSYQLGSAVTGFVPLFAASLVGAAGGAYWPIAVVIAVSGLIGFVCVLLVRRVPEDQLAQESSAEPKHVGP